MKKYSWQIVLALMFTLFSITVYTLHYFIFDDAHHIFTFMVSDIAFVPFEVLLVTLFLHRILERREKKHVLQKLNMVIGVFFSEIGRELMILFANADEELREILPLMKMSDDFKGKELRKRKKHLSSHNCRVNIEKIDLKELSGKLKDKRTFMIKLLENPYLLEHESFTELLRAVFHLEEEFTLRMEVDKLSKSDLEHLTTDIERVYKYLLKEWIAYKFYLKIEYPYLYKFVRATEPFDSM